MVEPAKKHWYEKLPHPYAILFFIILFAAVLTYIVPAGQYTRISIDTALGKRTVVDAASFKYLGTQFPTDLMGLFQSLPLGMIASGAIIFITLISGMMFKVIESTGALENGVGVMVKHLGKDRYNVIIWVVTYIFGFLGAAVGFENNIGIVPIAAMIALGMGGDTLIGATISAAAVGIGFATSPINVYTVGTAHAIAQLPIFSGALVRTVYCVVALAILAQQSCSYMKRLRQDPSKSYVLGVDTEGLALSKPLEEYSLTGTHKAVLAIFIIGMAAIVYGTLKFGWYLNQIMAVFLMITVATAVVARISPSKMVQTMMDGASSVCGGAMAIGIARAIQVVLENGKICDTIIHALVAPLQSVGTIASGWLMVLANCIINFFIPSGSGQAVVTMPIMTPIADMINMTRQVAVFCFQIGDGVTNLIYPTMGGLLAMLALVRVPFDRWFRFAFPLTVKVTLLGCVIMTVMSLMGWN
ncbi:MAG: YfcC family protein [Pyramidobacter sp.]|nr:YfcC family protein [Pyramidobacter sp.]